jgi:hypothetical protein
MATVLSKPAQFGLSRNPLEFKVSCAIASQQEAKVVYEIFFERTPNSVVYEKVASGALYPDNDGNVQFDVQYIIHAEIRRSITDVEIPPFSLSDPIPYNNFRCFFVAIAEKSRTTTQTAWQYIGHDATYNDLETGKTKSFCIYRGGIAQNIYESFGFFQNLNEENSYFSMLPRVRVVAINQPEYITWYNHTGTSKDVMLNCFATNAQGVPSAFNVFTETGQGGPNSVSSNRLAIFPIMWKRLIAEISSNPLEFVKMTCQVVENNPSRTVLGPLLTLILNPTYRESTHYIVYLNALGAPTTLRCVGEHTRKADIAKIYADRSRSVGGSVANAQSWQVGAKEIETFTYRSGYMRHIEVAAYKDLMVSEAVYEVSENGYIPLKIVSKNFKEINSGDYQTVIEFDAQIAYDYKNHTTPHMGLFPLGAVDWQKEDFDKQTRTQYMLKWT